MSRVYMFVLSSKQKQANSGVVLYNEIVKGLLKTNMASPQNIHFPDENNTM